LNAVVVVVVVVVVCSHIWESGHDEVTVDLLGHMPHGLAANSNDTGARVAGSTCRSAQLRGTSRFLHLGLHWFCVCRCP